MPPSTTTELHIAPLFPTEKMLSVLILGPGRESEWKQLRPHFERQPGFPPVSKLMGGRYWPNVAAFFHAHHGPDRSGNIPPRGVRIVPFAEDGVEDFSAHPRKLRRPKSTP